MFGSVIQQVALRSNETGQGHDNFFAYGIDRRIGDLCEQLFEVVVDHARLVGQNGQGSIIPHGTQRVSCFSDHRQEHELHGF